ncbi:helix-turn-helix transcriptional regulator [Sulfurimonas sp. ST-27]|uniref:helix-turn-helix transcriptional regulator n=1 Tax=Sulfurimonas sp. ST-27 TaxID=3400152 RepID=UPI003AB8FF99
MKKDYDKTLTRLVGILTKLSNEEMPTSKELADEYNVSMRTIQKDIKERLHYYPIVKDNEHRFRFEYGYSLKRTTLTNDEMVFLNLALTQFENVDDIDKIKNSIYKKIINKNFYSPYFIKQADLEDLDIESPFISELEQIIEDKKIVYITFTNQKKELELYKIAAFDGFWYILAKDIEEQKVKVFRLSDIKHIKKTEKYHHTSNKYIEEVLGRVHSAFFEDGNSFEVEVKVYKEIAIYFKNREFLESQEILDTYEDGSLRVKFCVSHDEDIDNIIKSWLPHIEVLKPKRYKDKLLNELQNYIKNLKTN